MKLKKQTDSLRSRKKSYDEYVISDGIAPDRIKQEKTASAAANQILYNASSGTRGEQLASRGLAFSGYGEYIRQLANRKSEDKKAEAVGDYYRAHAENESGYADYVNNYELLQKKAGESFAATIAEKGILDINEAIKLSAGSGLTEENAILAAAAGTRRAVEATIKRAGEFVKEHNYTYRLAKKYALSLGLKERDAELVAKATGRIDEDEEFYYATMDANDYFNFIKDKINPK